MELLPGFKLVELTEDKIVQEQDYEGEVNGKKYKVHCRMTGNPNPPPEEHQKAIDNVYGILYRAWLRNRHEEREKEALNEAA